LRATNLAEVDAVFLEDHTSRSMMTIIALMLTVYDASEFLTIVLGQFIFAQTCFEGVVFDGSMLQSSMRQRHHLILELL
jgi:hypothetical protein